MSEGNVLDYFDKSHVREMLQTVVDEQTALVENKQLCSEWAREHFSMGADAPWQSVKYQEDMLDVMALDVGPSHVFVEKSSRVGYSMASTALQLYTLAHARRNVILYMPTDKVALETAKDTINPAVKNTPPAKEAHDVIDDRRGGSTNTFKELAGKFLYILGAVSGDRFRRYSADLAVLDEVSSYKPNIDNEGSPVVLAHRSVRNSPFGRFVGGSTPTMESTCMIHREVEACAMVFHFRIPCPGCAAMVRLDWNDDEIGRIEFDGPDMAISKALDVDRRAESARYKSACCGREWRYTDMLDALPKGEWRTDGGYRIEAGNGNQPILTDKAGEVVKWPSRIAFRINALYSPWSDWADMVVAFLDAQSDIDKMRAWTNQWRGIPWQDTDREANPDDLRHAAEKIDALPDDARVVIMSIDNQDTNWLSVMVIAYGDGERSWILDRYEVHGSIEHYDSVGWQDLNEHIAQFKPVEKEDGTRLPLHAVCIDTGGLVTDAVYRASQYFPCKRRILFKGGSDKTAPIVKRNPTKIKIGRNKSVPLYLFNSHVAKEMVISRLNDGTIHLSRDLDPNVFDEFGAEKLTSRRNKYGRMVREWDVIADRNEALDCAAMGLAAIRLLNPPWRKYRLKASHLERAEVKAKSKPKPRRRPSKKRTVRSMASLEQIINAPFNDPFA